MAARPSAQTTMRIALATYPILILASGISYCMSLKQIRTASSLPAIAETPAPQLSHSASASVLAAQKQRNPLLQTIKNPSAQTVAPETGPVVARTLNRTQMRTSSPRLKPIRSDLHAKSLFDKCSHKILKNRIPHAIGIATDILQSSSQPSTINAFFDHIESVLATTNHIAVNTFFLKLTESRLKSKKMDHQAQLLAKAMHQFPLFVPAHNNLYRSIILDLCNNKKRPDLVVSHLFCHWKRIVDAADAPQTNYNKKDANDKHVIKYAVAILDRLICIADSSWTAKIESAVGECNDFTLRYQFCRTLIVHAAKLADAISIVRILKNRMGDISRSHMRSFFVDIIAALKASPNPSLVATFPDFVMQSDSKNRFIPDLIHALNQVDESKAALNLYNEFTFRTNPNLSAKSEAMVAVAAVYARRRDIPQLESLLHESVSQNLFNQKWIISWLVQTIADCNGLDAARQRVHDLMQSKSDVAHPTIMMLVHRFMESKRFTTALEMLDLAAQQTPKISIIDCTIVLQLYISTNQHERITNLLQNMKLNRIHPDKRFLRRLVRYLIDTDNMDHCAMIWNYVKTGKVSAAPNLLILLLQSAYQNKSVDLVMDIWAFGASRTVFWPQSLSCKLKRLCDQNGRFCDGNRIELYQKHVDPLIRKWKQSKS